MELNTLTMPRRITDRFCSSADLAHSAAAHRASSSASDSASEERIRVLSRKRDGDVARASGARREPRRLPKPPKSACFVKSIDLAAIFNGYDPASELSRWQERRPASGDVSRRAVRSSRSACDFWMRKSGGAFDPRAEALTRLWSRCARLGPACRPRTNCLACGL